MRRFTRLRRWTAPWRAHFRLKRFVRLHGRNYRRPFSFGVPERWYEVHDKYMTRLARIAHGRRPFTKEHA